MPVYTVHTSTINSQHQTHRNFAAAITKLHTQTFGGDPAAVRSEYLNQFTEDVINRCVSFYWGPWFLIRVY